MYVLNWFLPFSHGMSTKYHQFFIQFHVLIFKISVFYFLIVYSFSRILNDRVQLVPCVLPAAGGAARPRS